MTGKAKLTLPLNAQSIKAAKPVGGKTTEYQIGSERGFKLLVTPKGTGTYLMRYDIRRGDKRLQRKFKIGRRDAMSLADARRTADELRRDVEAGNDPTAVAVARREALTFQQLTEERFARDNDLADSSKRLYREALVHDAFPAIGHLAADEVTPQQIVAILDIIEARGARVQADRTKSAISGVYSWGRKRCLVTTNPTAGLGRRSSVTPRTRVLDEDELAAFWRATISQEMSLSPAMRHILQLAMLTGQRRTEIAGARRSELTLDGVAPSWTIPGDRRQMGRIKPGRTKNRKNQVLPLSQQVAFLFRQAISNADGSDYVFPSASTSSAAGAKTRLPHIHGESVSKAVRRLRANFSIPDVTIHDMRRAIATWLGEQGTRPDVIDRILNHRPRDVTRMHYNFAGMDDLVRSALQMWADHLDAIVEREAESEAEQEPV